MMELNVNLVLDKALVHIVYCHLFVVASLFTTPFPCAITVQVVVYTPCVSAQDPLVVRRKTLVSLGKVC